MKRILPIVVALAVSTIGVASQEKRVLGVQPFTVARGIELPYDMKLMQTQLVAELKVGLGKDFSVVSEAPHPIALKVADRIKEAKLN